MSVNQDTSTHAARMGIPEQDLGPLAWVREELRKSLEGAVRAMRRFVLEAQEARESDLAALDSSPLRMAKQQLHQSAGALDMVGQPQAAWLLHAMEAAVQHYVKNPSDCTDAAVQTLEKTSFALLEYLDVVLAGKRVLPVTLFPQYRDVQALHGQEGKIHPADLWPMERSLREPAMAVEAPAQTYGPQARSVLDTAVLQIVKTADPDAAARLRDLSLGLAQSQASVGLRIFWKVAAGFFDAMAHRLIAPDVYAKRVASRVLMVYANLAKGQAVSIERLLQDMLFFCAQAITPPSGKALVLQAVRDGFDLQRHVRVDYEKPFFGRFDPAQLALARKRMAAAAELWSSLAGGDKQKIKQVVDQFSLVSESLLQLHPSSQSLAQVLTQVMRRIEQLGQPPSAEVAMEVATAVLYLQAAFVSLDIAEADMAAQTYTLAERLVRVFKGQEPAPLEPWMEQLYRQVSDQQTMGSVVGELRQTLNEAEKYLDQYFRAPENVQPLQPVGCLLAQMRGVLSVLGLDAASQAMGQMRRYVENLQTAAVPLEERQVVFDKLGNSLGVLGFLIDMLSYQPSMARKLYIYDDAEGELKLIMGRSRARQEDDPAAEAVPAPAAAVPEPTPVPPASVALPTAAPSATPPAPAAPAVAVPATPIPAPAPAVPPTVPAPSAAPPAAPQPAPVPAPMQEPKAPVAPPAAVAAAPSTAPEYVPAAPPLEPAQHSAAAAAVAVPAPVLQAIEEDSDEELREIFLEEASEVITNGQAALQALAQDAGDLGEQTILRRAFHTLKGSSRMVGLDEFGEAAWAMEQMLNAWLAEQKPMPDPMQTLATQAMQGFAQWVQAIRDNQDAAWQATAFRASADAMRLDGKLVALDMAAASGQAVAQPVAELQPEHQDQVQALELEPVPAEVTEPPQAHGEAPPLLQPLATELVAAPDVPPETKPDVDTASEPILAVEPSGLSGLHAVDDAVRQEPESTATAETLGLDFAVDFSGFDVPQVEEASPATGAVPAAVHLEAENNTEENSAAPAGIGELPELTFDLESVSPLQDAAEELESMPAPEPQPTVQPESVVEAEPQLALDAAETKVIGDLSIPLPLFNVYLAEAEGWSQNLCNSLAEWAADVSQPQPTSAHAWAHALAGSSATVGFSDLSSLARLLENVLLHLQPLPEGQLEHAQITSAAADEIRRMLHQFAAGFLAQPQADVLSRLQALLNVPVLEEVVPAAAVEAPGSAHTEQVAFPEFAEFNATLAIPDAAEEAALSEPEAFPAQEQSSPSLDVPMVVDMLAPTQEPVVLPEPEPMAAAAEDGARTEQPSPQVLQALQAQQELDAAMARAMAIDDDEDDDIDALDMVDPDLFPIFEEEARDLLPTLSASLREWSSHPQRTQPRAVLLRALHTLKGSARLAGAMRLGEMAHRLESFLEQFDVETVTAEELEPVFVKLDAMEAAFHVLCTVSAQEHLEQSAPAPAPTLAATTSTPSADLAPGADGAAPAVPVVQSNASTATPPTLVAPTVTMAARPGSQALVRVRTQLLDRLVNDAGEVMITRSRLDARVSQLKSFLGELSTNLDRLRHQLRDMEVQAESQMQSRQQLTKDSGSDFDPLEVDRCTC